MGARYVCVKIESKGEDTGHILIHCILPDLELQIQCNNRSEQNLKK